MHKTISVDELRFISDMTVKLVELRQNECKHLSIEDIAPELFGRLLTEYSMHKNGKLRINTGELLT